MKETPTLLVHGDISDLLNDQIVDDMRAVCPGMEYVRVPRIGHAPFMTEPAAWPAIEQFISRID